MKLRVWGVRGSQASPGPDTARYGGNTSCFDIDVGPRSMLVLDAGTGIRALGRTATDQLTRVDILLSHLHMDHIQGLGFFDPIYRSDVEVHIWGPASSTMSLRQRLTRYLSPPLFPIRIRDLPCQLEIHQIPFEPFELAGVTITADLVCHPGPTCGFRLEADGGVIAYLPDHEPRLGAHDFPNQPEWMSGAGLAHRADVVLHDSQYTHAEYENRVGWGHSTFTDALDFAVAAEAAHLMLIHHDPGHDDATIDDRLAMIAAKAPDGLVVSAGREGDVLEVGA